MRSCAKLELNAVVAEASQVLARLDADRLDQMACYCEVLISHPETGVVISAPADCQMATFARVLEATRANLQVIRRVRKMKGAQLEYCPEPGGWARSARSEHGEH